MKVLITSPVFPPDLGGPATYVPSLGRFLVERGHEVHVVAFCSDPHPAGHPFRVTSIARGSLPARYLKAFVEVWKAAKHADVVYVNEHLALLHVLAAKLRAKPVMIRIMVDGSWEIAHRKGWIGGDGIDAYQGKSYGLKVALVRALQKLWWSWCDHIISCSDYLRGILVASYGVEPGKVQRVWNAHHGPRAEDVTITRAQARARLGVDPRRPLVLTICRLMGWKRVDNILRALAELPPDTQLAVAGDGDMEVEWKALGASLGLGDRVLWLGNVPHKDIPTWIRAADVFVLNSEYEGLSHTLVEVLHLGTPIVASRVCGNPEVVVDGVNGLLIDPRDHRSTRDAIAKILSNKDLADQFAAAGMARRDDFDRERTFGEVVKALERLSGRI
ncbi:MAG: hypothetical protein RL112_1674 [Planctomycetota bacterium]|jgi:glycosyltransferase involved in cell wall biosynthesis